MHGAPYGFQLSPILHFPLMKFTCLVRRNRKLTHYRLLRLNDCEGRGGNSRRTTKARKPLHASFLAKPGELALGEAACGLLDLLHGVFFVQAAGEMFAQLRIPYELERLRVRRNAARDERTNFCEPSGFEHRGSARVNARVERGAWRQQAELDDFVALQRIASAA